MPKFQARRSVPLLDDHAGTYRAPFRSRARQLGSPSPWSRRVEGCGPRKREAVRSVDWARVVRWTFARRGGLVAVAEIRPRVTSTTQGGVGPHLGRLPNPPHRGCLCSCREALLGRWWRVRSQVRVVPTYTLHAWLLFETHYFLFKNSLFYLITFRFLNIEILDSFFHVFFNTLTIDSSWV